MLIQAVQSKIGIWKQKGSHRSWETSSTSSESKVV